MEPSLKVGRMCAMDACLHGIGGDRVVVHTGHDSLSAPWGGEYSTVLANPPFGKKQSLLFVNEEGDIEREGQVVILEDFCSSASRLKKSSPLTQRLVEDFTVGESLFNRFVDNEVVDIGRVGFRADSAGPDGSTFRCASIGGR